MAKQFLCQNYIERPIKIYYYKIVDVPRMQQRSVEIEIEVYVLRGSEGCEWNGLLM